LGNLLAEFCVLGWTTAPTAMLGFFRGHGSCSGDDQGRSWAKQRGKRVAVSAVRSKERGRGTGQGREAAAARLHGVAVAHLDAAVRQQRARPPALHRQIERVE